MKLMAIVMVALPMLGNADTLTLSSGVKLENVEIVGHDAARVRYKTESGGGSVLLSNLCKEDQERFEYDAEEAKANLEEERLNRVRIDTENARALAAAKDQDKQLERVKGNYATAEEKKAALARMAAIEDQVAMILNRYDGRRPEITVQDKDKAKKAAYARTPKGDWRPASPMTGNIQRSFEAKDLAKEYNALKAILSLPEPPAAGQ